MQMICKLILTTAIVFGITACNTVKGFGEDMQQGGQELQKAATKN
jgi:predicted small secreted protein